MHESSYREMERFSLTLDCKPLRIADVGSRDVTGGNYRGLFEHPGWTYVGLDVEGGVNVDTIVPLHGVWENVPAESFDVVISGQTLEHTTNPWALMREIARIAKPGARLCIIAPFGWEHHRYPVDCWRIFPDGMAVLFADAGLTLDRVYMVGNPPLENLKGDTVGIGRKPVIVGDAPKT